ncbi:MAG: 30S ribosomal protein S4 [Gammaproteobacteria bacterium]
MANYNYRQQKCKPSRQWGFDLGAKSGVRPLESKCKLNRKPGQFGAKRGRPTDYGIQLGMKQLLRGYYGVLERQFRRYYSEASRKKGATGEQLLKLLESRLDNVVYRLGFARTRAEARQLVSHGTILLNGQLVNIPSCSLKPNDVIEVRVKAKNQLRIAEALDLAKQRKQPEWLEIDAKEKRGVFKTYPEASELPPEFKVNLIVELYSK